MLCLGIESTAHTFGCSIVESCCTSSIIRGRIVSDSRDVYKPTGGSGIHPRDASRHHCEISDQVFRDTLRVAKLSIEDIDVISYSAGPGLGPCLRVGAVIARTLAAFHDKPLVPVNHALGHVELGAMLTGADDPLVLLVSGGHTMILAFSEHRWRIFGETLDITIGQLLDQFGRHLGFSSPCGDRIERLASQSSGNYQSLPYVVKGNDVSFSGLLTAAIRAVSDQGNELECGDVSYSLQETAFSMITEAVERALSFTSKRQFLIVGGVAANNRLARMLKIACERQSSKFYLCPAEYAGDNGAQIAWAGMLQYMTTRKNVEIEEALVYQSWRIDEVEVSWTR
ncbi:MAG TPA: KEOPS complex N(6)-L-threonylcarbamoyladenine synthase Kae1 [Candidatus Nitrosopolaris sp.]|nr:KEOPS complex N(6)-L-threonylcarbamoyladenine synthase Kae1 [Candidatus Nitrosopolaris sp.]